MLPSSRQKRKLRQQAASTALNAACSTPKMETVSSSVKSINLYQISRHHIPEDSQRRKNLKSHISLKLIFQNIQTLLIMGSVEGISFTSILLIIFKEHRKRKPNIEK
jgi:hypothetical protein